MKNRCLDRESLRSQLRQLVAALLRPDILEPDEIADDRLLSGASLCPDSLDALELALCVEEKFGIAIRSGDEARGAFTNIAHLADFIRVRAQTLDGIIYVTKPDGRPTDRRSQFRENQGLRSWNTRISSTRAY